MPRKTITLDRIENPGEHGVIRPTGFSHVAEGDGDTDYVCPECGFVVLKGLDSPGARLAKAALQCAKCRTVGVLPPAEPT